MRRKEELRLLKRSLELNTQHEIDARYEDKGIFKTSLSPSKKVNKSLEKQYLLITKKSIDIKENDRIEGKEGLYRVLWAQDYPKHKEVLIEKEH
ncbi:MAG TPA: hypothetical protein PK712_09405 [Rectinema sp.]|nr:hypothetical protein [Rectinema sp.]